MKVTSKSIAEHFNVKVSSVKQIDSKQLFEVWTPSGYYLVSYYTIVGRLIGGIWYLTKQKYSVTTSKQLTLFSYGRNVVYVDDINNIKPSLHNVNGIE